MPRSLLYVISASHGWGLSSVSPAQEDLYGQILCHSIQSIYCHLKLLCLLVLYIDFLPPLRRIHTCGGKEPYLSFLFCPSTQNSLFFIYIEKMYIVYTYVYMCVYIYTHTLYSYILYICIHHV